MKNHIIFKMIALVLCAASLLGAIAGFSGVALLTGGNLYNRTVDDMLEAQMQDDSRDYANWLARNYASSELGDCPDSLVGAQYGSHWFPSRYDNYGYAILDSEGQELLSLRPEAKENAAFVHTYPVEGKYIHLVSIETESEKDAREAQVQMSNYGMTPVESLKGATLPEEGTGVGHAVFTGLDGSLILEVYLNGGAAIVNYYDEHGNGSHQTMATGQQVGYLYYDREDRLVFRGNIEVWDPIHNGPIPERDVGSVYFFTPSGGADVALSSKEGVGRIFGRDGSVMFETYETVVAEETIPETTPETIPETFPETIPQETAAVVTEPLAETTPLETIPQTLPAETIPSAASAVPEESAAVEETVWPEPETAPAETVLAEPLPPQTLPAETVAYTVPQTLPTETVPAITEPVMINGKRLEEYQINRTRFHDGEWVEAQYVYLPMPALTVEIYFRDNAVRGAAIYDALRLVRQFRDLLLPVALGCLLIFALCVVYLCIAAGRKPKSDEIQAAGLNRLPLDLYLGLGGIAAGGVAALMLAGGEPLFEADFIMACTAMAAGGFLCCLIFVGFCFAFVAQLKMPDGYWYKNTLLCRFAVLCVRLPLAAMPITIQAIQWSWRKIIQTMIWLYKITERGLLWTARVLGRVIRKMGVQIARFYGMLPLIWQWLVGGAVALLFSLLLFTGEFLWVLLGLAVPLVILIYSAESFGTLAESAKRMSKGDLNTKVDDSKLIGCFKESAADLNALADVAVIAAQNQLKSERMKTELITNVSHDIKTPLTSIINYVDLLQKPHTEEEEAQYLEVLDRQSQRLKKLIDDLMDMSKASTGNMTVEITRVDAVESVNQALGEFADKLSKAQLIPVFRHSEASIPMMADGRLVWRVLSNLLGNAVKYALPGTRMYIDLQSMEGKVVLSLKNISREELNVDADELMERFVRGDDSRNTEGSGLGLNIAKSLMELQKGQLQVLVDGDLFKITLIFPGV